MSDVELPEDDQLVSGGTLKGWHLFVIVVLALGLAAGAYWWFVARPGGGEVVPTAGVTEVPEGSRTVTLFFADEDEPVLFSESRQVAIGKGTVEQAGQVMRALIGGPEQRGVNAIPAGTSLLDVFFDGDTGILYLDFSGELVAGHPGGAAAEYGTVLAIMKTTSENFPEVQAVQILVEGYQVGTIAGHINAYKPFHVLDWR